MKPTLALAPLLLALLPACCNSPESGEPGIPAAALPHPLSPAPGPGVPAPGPVPLRSLEQLHAYLCSAEFRAVEDWWRFDDGGAYASELGGVGSQGRWTTTKDGLWLSRFGGEEETTLPLKWLDGKYRIDIDGVQYMRDWDIIRDRPRD